jgi:hypothetical protein
MRRHPAVVRRTLVLRPPPFSVSRNWSGYVVPSASPVTEVSGRFTVPRLNCSNTPDAGESTWTGIGGTGGSSGDLLQTGVVSLCSGGSQVENAAWWELVPPLPEQDFTSMSVSPGDSIQATVEQNPDGSWTTRLDDLTTRVSGVMTTGIGYGTVLDSAPTVWVNEESTTVPASYGGGHTAEWIVEDFELSNGSLVPLADFGTVSFSGLTTSQPSWALGNEDALGINVGPLLYSAPSTPDSSGRGFSVTYTG